jgi:hypothetical protein
MCALDDIITSIGFLRIIRDVKFNLFKICGENSRMTTNFTILIEYDILYGTLWLLSYTRKGLLALVITFSV